jgi:hypothetical protein
MLVDEFEPTARHDRAIARLQGTLLAAIVIAVIGALVAGVLSGGPSLETLPPYTVADLSGGLVRNYVADAPWIGTRPILNR